ncbi:protein of unknown function [Halobacillus karajensis]|uniref:DUF4352 domain-containing protein n=1 Tax=Halobacillus karajensis TaxID=195088 RepID=A0A059NX97_9BACI|nr:DUF4352 domain-containing protein [Halobacillus karajensis]CDQ18528.1 hypothetical protein BN982_00801 [Halobacillus karajensis]CDQ23400.1 hypothetical protein BN983_01627 [Halobacillus karajensis]CDQ26882.1 hypothetical protein BN981_01107 [Halobacillus karajensis]SEH50334.1 protein of unknown function [Halobacillus karajensis]
MKPICGLMLFTVLLLAGCIDGEASATNESSDEKHAETTKEEGPSAGELKEDHFTESPQAPDDSELTDIGSTYSDEDGKLKLHAYTEEEQQLTVGPMNVTVKEAKFMNYKPSPDLIDFFHGFTHEETDFNYVKLRVIVENTSDHEVNFAPVSHLETNNGEKKSFVDDFYLEELHGDYTPGEVRKGQLGFILEKADAEKLKDVTFQTSDAFRGEESMKKGEEYTISF